MYTFSSATSDLIGPRPAGACERLSGTLVEMSTSERGGSSPAGERALLASQCRARDLPGKGDALPRPARSATVAGRSRRLTGARTSGHDGRPEGGTITSGTSTRGRYRLRP